MSWEHKDITVEGRDLVVYFNTNTKVVMEVALWRSNGHGARKLATLWSAMQEREPGPMAKAAIKAALAKGG